MPIEPITTNCSKEYELDCCEFQNYVTAMGIQAENLASMMASTTSARMVGVVSALDLQQSSTFQI